MTEKQELDDKRQKLTSFIAGEIFAQLDQTERSRLSKQLTAMTVYSEILGERIAAFAP